MNKDQKSERDYEAPQLIAVELQTGQSLLQVSKDDYINGGESVWGEIV